MKHEVSEFPKLGERHKCSVSGITSSKQEKWKQSTLGHMRMRISKIEIILRVTTEKESNSK